MVDMNSMIRLGQGKQITDERGESRGLSWIKPQMMHQVFSSMEFSQGKRAAQFPSKMELLNLFPESRISSEPETTASGFPPLSKGFTESRSVYGSSSKKESSAELVIFYNGAVKAFHVSGDDAEAVMKLASSNSSGERATLKPLQGENQQTKKLAAGLPMASKLSLQRFIEKRKERLGSLTPYASSDKGMSKVRAEEKEGKDQQISLSLSFLSQRSR